MTEEMQEFVGGEATLDVMEDLATVEQNGIEFTAGPDDWILKDGNDDLSLMPEAILEQEYEPVTKGGSKKASKKKAPAKKEPAPPPAAPKAPPAPPAPPVVEEEEREYVNAELKAFTAQVMTVLTMDTHYRSLAPQTKKVVTKFNQRWKKIQSRFQ